MAAGPLGGGCKGRFTCWDGLSVLFLKTEVCSGLYSRLSAQMRTKVHCRHDLVCASRKCAHVCVDLSSLPHCQTVNDVLRCPLYDM
jgi:hypothetical protein